MSLAQTLRLRQSGRKEKGQSKALAIRWQIGLLNRPRPKGAWRITAGEWSRAGTEPPYIVEAPQLVESVIVQQRQLLA
jgi:hypothetical protein